MVKFRGKRIDNGEWVYGGYYKHFNGQVGILGGDKTENNITIMDEVIPETVGQFTGLHDKNGKEIYEGDIIQGKHDLILIKWAKTGFIPYRNKNFFFSKVTNWASAENGEVIGNIYDNPELLEVKQDGN